MSKKQVKGQSKHFRYRMSDFTARQIGLTPNKQMRYRLKKNSEALKKYLSLSMEKPIKRLFFDIETSMFRVDVFRIGTKVFIQYDDVVELAKIICISWKFEGDNEVKNLSWDENQCDKSMIEKFVKVMNEADEIIGHNGDNFDVKWLRTRAIYHRIPMMPKYRTLDTLKKARSNFYFPNNKLDTIAQYLGVGAKVKHEGKKMWKKVQSGDKQALKDMIKYCDGDIVVLEDVYFAMQNYIKPNTHAGVVNGNLKYSCPNCGNEHNLTLLKNDVTEKGTISRVMECDSCGQNYNISNSSYKNYLEFSKNKFA